MRSTSNLPAPTPETGAVLSTLAASLDIGVVLLDGDSVLLVNEAAADMRVVLGQGVTAPVLSELARTARRDGATIARDVEIPWGSISRAVHAVAAPVTQTAQVVLLLTDLQEARRLEAVRRDFVANVSHELKTPIGAVSLLAEALRDAADDPDALRHFTDRLSHEAARMSRLVQDLLDLSRLQGGEPLPALAPVRVRDLLAEAAEPLHVRAEAAGITLDVGDAGELTALGDHRQLVTALTNLIENAIAYSSRSGRVGVGARKCADDETGTTIEISVSDEGVGIEQSEQERVFERFYRVDTARSRATGGTGLGLAIVKHVMRNHGGRVSLWSKVGVGSTFTLHLREAPADTGKAAHL